MQAYASTERLPLSDQLTPFDRTTPARVRQAVTPSEAESGLFDELLGRLADLVVGRLAAQTAADSSDHLSVWLDARAAATYLGIHRDTLRKFAAQRAIPAHQDGPGCKLYFRRDELDEWRRSERPTGQAARRLRAVS
jgi:excisionase family DNA binding protein